VRRRIVSVGAERDATVAVLRRSPAPIQPGTAKARRRVMRRSDTKLGSVPEP
jgi:hypothetical protein